jgi:hypothetical protein
MLQVLAGNPIVYPSFDALFHLSLLSSLDMSNCRLQALHGLQFVSQVRSSSVGVELAAPMLPLFFGHL